MTDPSPNREELWEAQFCHELNAIDARSSEREGVNDVP